jgi:hypothetical protein
VWGRGGGGGAAQTEFSAPKAMPPHSLTSRLDHPLPTHLAPSPPPSFTRPWSAAGKFPEAVGGNPDPAFGALATVMHFIGAVTIPGPWPADAKALPPNDQTIWTVMRGALDCFAV